MKTKLHSLSIVLALLAFSTLNPQFSTAFAQGTAFSYNGKLNDGVNPANGSYDLRFTLYNAVSNGSAVGSLTNIATGITNGLFTVTLDFGGVFNGSNYWLELAARTNGGGAFTVLSPRQAILSTPYAIYSDNAGNAGTATTAASATSATTAGSATTATTANNFSGSLAGDVTGTQSATVVSTVGGVTAANVASGANAANAATSLNTASTIVMRDASGNFSAGSVTLNNNLYLPGPTATVYSGGSSFLHSDTNNNFFAGPGAGNLAASGFGNTANGPGVLRLNTSGQANTASGFEALHDNTSGSANTANGYQASQANTSGSDNTAIGLDALLNNTTGNYNIALGDHAGFNIGFNTTSGSSNIDIGNMGVATDTNIIRIGDGQTQTFIAGVLNGNGGGLTNLNGSQVTGGTVADARLSANVALLNAANTFSANQTINGAVGIGVAASTATVLHIVSPNANAHVLFESSVANGNPSLTVKANSPAGEADIVADRADTGASATHQFATGGAVDWRFGTPNFTSGEPSRLDLGNASGTPVITFHQNGSVGIGTNASVYPLEMASGAYCSVAGVWTSVSDRNVKEDFTSITPIEVLAKVATLPITQWKYKVEPNGIKHIGPVAQDFHSAFGLGDSDKAIGSVDETGVALAAIQGLNQKLEQQSKEKDVQIQTLKQQNDSLAERLNELETTVKALAERK